MRTMETGSMMVLNNIIYRIYATENLNEMREQLLEQLRMMMDFDRAVFYLADSSGNGILSCPYFYNCDEKSLTDVKSENEMQAGTYGGSCVVYRRNDLRYARFLKNNVSDHSLNMVLGKDRKFLGMITFYRSMGKEDFGYNDIALLDFLKEHIALRLEKDKENMAHDMGRMTVDEAAEKYELTKREHTILEKLLECSENDAVCEELGISVNTLKKHILNIYRKLGIKNRVQMFKMIKEI
ncbi:MAG: LuxR C-terminal-related transcriptional regulator [Lachnospiraceae bacterium]|nr:LuxR C-terminal-related transcriptional regulator [Lachnospiraceae bacterium]